MWDLRIYMQIQGERSSVPVNLSLNSRGILEILRIKRGWLMKLIPSLVRSRDMALNYEESWPGDSNDDPLAAIIFLSSTCQPLDPIIVQGEICASNCIFEILTSWRLWIFPHFMSLLLLQVHRLPGRHGVMDHQQSNTGMGMRWSPEQSPELISTWSIHSCSVMITTNLL